MRCSWNLAKTQFGIVLEYFRWDAIRIWLRHNMGLSYGISDEMQLEFGKDTIWNCLRMFSMGCN